MAARDAVPRFHTVGDGTGLTTEDTFTREELQLASRNRGMPLEGLRYPVTPTGMHYLLVHFDIPEVDVTSWRLEVGGLVTKPWSLSIDDLRTLPSVTHTVTMECAGNGRALLNPRPVSQPWLLEAFGTAEWTGAPLRGVLDEAGLSDRAVEVLFTGRDRGVQGDEVQDYRRSLTLEEASRGEVLLAYEMNGEPLQPQHGFPLRLLVPGWYGMTSVKWLDRIDAISEHFDGYQMERTYRYIQDAGDPGNPVELIRVRSLMVPPGIPDFMTRTRLLDAGRVELKGRAWAGRLGISRVEVSSDGGKSWSDAEVDPSGPEFAWRGWSFIWEAALGRHTLCVRATDTEGNVQPVDQPWNLQGMGNNMAQRVEVIVE